MSRHFDTIALEPGSRITREAFMSRPVACPYCGGSGSFIGDGPGGGVVMTCPDCLGSGRVAALVTVDWKPFSETEP